MQSKDGRLNRAEINRTFVYNHHILEPRTTYWPRYIQEGALPGSLTSLCFGALFNQPLAPGVLPASLRHLQFGDDYNRPFGVDVLPASLVYLKLGEHYSQPMGVGVLPASLRSLAFGVLHISMPSLGGGGFCRPPV